MSRAGLVILDYGGVVTRIIFIQGLQTGSFCNEDQERKPITTKLLEQVLSSFAEGVTAALQAKLLICSDAPVQQGSLSNVHAAKALAKRKRLQAQLDLYNKVSGFYSTLLGHCYRTIVICILQEEASEIVSAILKADSCCFKQLC